MVMPSPTTAAQKGKLKPEGYDCVLHPGKTVLLVLPTKAELAGPTQDGIGKGMKTLGE